jgi:hypothetical protein
LSAPTRARALSLSLAALWGRAIGAVLSPPPPRPLSLCPTVSTCQPYLTSRPRSPRCGRAHVRAFFGHVPVPAPLLSPHPARPPSLAHLRPLPNPLALSLALPTHAGSFATARRRSLPVMRPPSRSRPIQCHGELRLAASCSGHPSVCPFPLCFVRSTLTRAISTQPEPRHRRLVASLCLRRCFATPTLPLKVSNPPVPLIWSSLLCCPHDCSPELSRAAVSPPRHGLRLLVPLRQREGHG